MRWYFLAALLLSLGACTTHAPNPANSSRETWQPLSTGSPLDVDVVRFVDPTTSFYSSAVPLDTNRVLMLRHQLPIKGGDDLIGAAEFNGVLLRYSATPLTTTKTVRNSARVDGPVIVTTEGAIPGISRSTPFRSSSELDLPKGTEVWILGFPSPQGKCLGIDEIRNLPKRAVRVFVTAHHLDGTTPYFLADATAANIELSGASGGPVVVNQGGTWVTVGIYGGRYGERSLFR